MAGLFLVCGAGGVALGHALTSDDPATTQVGVPQSDDGPGPGQLPGQQPARHGFGDEGDDGSGPDQ